MAMLSGGWEAALKGEFGKPYYKSLYESVLKELYQSGEESIREGYHRLLAGWLISLYTTQRKYKDALAIQTEHAYV